MHQRLTKKLTNSLTPSHLEVIDESNNHSGTATESHFKIIVVSDKFVDLNLIDRHRFIHKLLQEELKLFHAIAIHTYTPDEWDIKKHAPESPQCSSVKSK